MTARSERPGDDALHGEPVVDLPQRRPHPLVPTRAHRLQDVVLDEREPTLWIFVEQLLQPLTW